MHLYRERLGKVLSRLPKREGQAMVEYALILALVSLGAMGALHCLGGAVPNHLHHIANTVNRA